MDGGFVNTFARAFKQEPEEDKKQRIKGMKKELAEYLDDEGHLIVYRGSFERPFGREEDASRVIEKGFAFSLDREVAKNYAVCWFPETAKIYEVKAPLSDVAWYCIMMKRRQSFCCLRIRADSGQLLLKRLCRSQNMVRILKKPLLCRHMQQLSRENKQAAKDKEN